jgi:hypothetical protein
MVSENTRVSSTWNITVASVTRKSAAGSARACIEIKGILLPFFLAAGTAWNNTVSEGNRNSPRFATRFVCCESLEQALAGHCFPDETARRYPTALNAQYEDAPRFLLVRASGAYALKEMLALFEGMGTTARARGVRRMLLDVSEVTGDVSDLDRYELGKEAAALLAHVERLAVVRRPDLQYTSFAFDVAQNRGLHARGFIDPKEAEAWLVSA